MKEHEILDVKNSRHFKVNTLNITLKVLHKLQDRQQNVAQFHYAYKSYNVYYEYAYVFCITNC